MKTDLFSDMASSQSDTKAKLAVSTETVIDTRKGSITSPFGSLHTADTTSSVVNLVDGEYVFSFTARGFASNWSSAYSRLFSYSLAGEYLGVIAMEHVDNMDAGSIDADKKNYFSISEASGKIFVWDTGVTAQGGTISYCVALSRVTATAPKNAGGNLSTLARAGFEHFLKSRHAQVPQTARGLHDAF